ncbi:MAG: septal ring lytic transglycosylase RlpA family protein [Actinomycetota bacterium]|nr:septal ring lytic transglycosylase RlpA family protein [Actinomycetota bacterium]
MSIPRRSAVHAAAAAVFAALVAVAVVVPASAADVAELRARAQALGDQVSVLEGRLENLSDRRAALDRKIASASAEIGTLELELHDHQYAASAAREVVVERVVEAYKGSTTDRLGLLLEAEDLAELEAYAELTGHAAEADAEAFEELLDEQAALEAAQERVDARKQALLAAQTQADALAEEAAGALAERKDVLAELTAEVEELERQAREAAAAAARPEQAFLDLLSPAGPSPGIPDDFVGTGVTFEGLASWYGPGFEGNLTASGDVFDSSLYTAASKELPLGTWLHVEYNGRGVVVLVNDRGPYVEPRILDLSRGAAQAIGMEHAGVGWVKAEILIKK